MRRINTGEVVETAYRGLIPGLLGPNFINRSFDENDECRILSEFFKDKIVQQKKNKHDFLFYFNSIKV